MVSKGESNLEVGQLVDGALKPVNGTNITALETNVTSADNKESSCLAVWPGLNWISLSLARQNTYAHFCWLQVNYRVTRMVAEKIMLTSNSKFRHRPG